jgi:hypothetical protein
LRAVDQLHLLEFRSARSKEWPVQSSKVFRFVAALLAVAALALGSACLGPRVGAYYKENHLLLELSPRDSLIAALQRATEIQKY